MRKYMITCSFLCLFFPSFVFCSDSLLTTFIDLAQLMEDSADFDQALSYNLKAIDLAKSKQENTDSLQAKLLAKTGYLYIEKYDFDNALNAFSKSFKLRQEKFGAFSKPVAKSMISMGYYYDSKTNYDLAIDFYKQAWKIMESIDETQNDPLFGILFNNLAVCYMIKNDAGKAVQFFNKALYLDIKEYGEDHIYVGIDYHNLGSYYFSLNKFSESLAYYQKAFDIYQSKLGKGHPDIVGIYTQIGRAYKRLEDYESAEKYYDKALKLGLNTLGEWHESVAYVYRFKAELYMSKKMFDKSKTYAEESLVIYKKLFGEFNFNIAIMNKIIGEIHSNKKDYKKALAYFTKSQHSLGYSEELKLTPLNLDFQQLLLNTFFLKASCNLLYFKEIGNSILLEQSKKILKDAISIFDLLKVKFKDQSSKEFIFEEYHSIFDLAIEVNYELWNITRDTHYLYQAFEISEKSKGNQLLDAFNKSKAERFAGIPDSFLVKEVQLQKEISFYEKLIYEKKEAGDSTSQVIYKMNSKIFDLKLAYDELISKIEKNYPSYFRIKYRSEIPSIQEIQYNLLSPGQGLVEYFVGDSSIFIFTIDKHNFQGYKIKKDFALEEMVYDFHQTTSIHSVMASALQDSINQRYIYLAVKLYEKLFKPIITAVPSRFTLIPDGILGYIPFEALLVEKPTQSNDFRSHQYLLRKYIISYNYSAALLKEFLNQNHAEEKKNFIGFAPQFKDNRLYSVDRLDLGPLKFNVPEIEMLQSMTGGDGFVNEEATEENFVKHANKYKIIHLATHGAANDLVGEYSYLAFTEKEDTLENELLYAKDVYNLKLNAELVVLSACETGLGNMKHGEGIISLARGFSYSGASAIVPSLWQINDTKVVMFMEFFYQNLKKGMDKDMALQNAKIQYINNNSNLVAEPFFWAPFILIGNVNPIELATDFTLSFNPILIILITILLVICAIILIGKQKIFRNFLSKHLKWKGLS